MANNTDIERLNYYEGEFLGALDFEAEQEYHREMRRRHNIGQHTWGIVSGLDLVQIPNGATSPSGNPEVDIYVQPGMAADGFGREVVVLNKTQLTQDLFAPYFDSNPAAPPKPMYVWISYAQAMLQLSTDACAQMNQPNAYGRVQETFALTVTPDSNGPTNDLIVVDGKPLAAPVQPGSSPPPPPQPGDVVLPYDDSVPYQEFATDDASVNWYIAIGRVFWDPHNEVFVQQPDPWPAVGREYAGNVTATVFSPNNSLKILDRFAPYPLPPDPTDPTLGQFYGGVGVEVGGSLTVDRLLEAEQNILIDGAPDPSNPTLSPLTIKASGTNQELIQTRDSSGIEKWLICQNPNGTNPGLNIGEIPSGGTSPGSTRLFLQTGGNVGIGTLTPVANLDVGAGLLHVGATPSPTVAAPGAYMGWNALTGGTGETDFINNQGGGSGGFAFMNTPPTGSPRSTLMVITGGGNVGIGTTAPVVPLEVAGEVRVQGNLRVAANQNIFGVKVFSMAQSNQTMTDTFRTWSVDYTGQFEQVYTVLAVFQGFSSFNNDGNPTFSNTDHKQDDRFIPQHAFVRVDFHDENKANGVCYCSESDPTQQSNSSIFFSVVVMGKPKF